MPYNDRWRTYMIDVIYKTMQRVATCTIICRLSKSTSATAHIIVWCSSRFHMYMHNILIFYTLAAFQMEPCLPKCHRSVLSDFSKDIETRVCIYSTCRLHNILVVYQTTSFERSVKTVTFAEVAVRKRWSTQSCWSVKLLFWAAVR